MAQRRLDQLTFEEGGTYEDPELFQPDPQERGPVPSPAPSNPSFEGVPQDFVDDFLRRNPGDAHRVKDAYAPTSHRVGDSQDESLYDTRTHEYIGGAKAPAKASTRLSNGPSNQSLDSLMATLQGLFPGGGLNTDVLNRRFDSARDQITAAGKRTRANNEAALASRGLIGDGPEITAQNRLDERLLATENNALNDIFADESENADARMMQALGLATGLESDMMRNAVDQFRANTERDLGFGNLDLNRMLGSGRLAIDNMGSVNDYNLGLGRLQLDRDKLINDIENGDIDRLLQLIEQLMAGSQISAGGYIG